jgi:hypothetical protein
VWKESRIKNERDKETRGEKIYVPDDRKRKREIEV